nr:hypothetical protein [Suaeda aralocaspica]
MDYTYYYSNTKFPSSSSSTPTLISPSNHSLNNSNTNNAKNQANNSKKYNNNNNNNKNKKPKARLSTDPQSVAARERRHKISDRFKILQSLIPGGAKLDIVSMLDEAIHYVKFLKSQIVLHETILNNHNDNNNNNNDNNNVENNDNGEAYYYDQYFAPIMCNCCNDNYIVGDQQIDCGVEGNMETLGWNMQAAQIHDLWGYYQQNGLQFIDDKRHLA